MKNKKGTDEICETLMTQNFPELIDMKQQVQETPRTLNNKKNQNTIPTHIVIQQQKIKDKENIFLEATGKNILYKEE